MHSPARRRESELHRRQELFSAGVVSREELERFSREADVAKAKYEAAVQQHALVDERVVGHKPRTLDFARPTALLLLGMLHLIQDAEGPYDVVARLMDSLPSGSYLVISHPASDIDVVGIQNLAYQLHELLPMELKFRSRAEVAALFDGLELVEPGLVRVPEWRPDSDADGANPATVWGGVARKRSQ